MTGYSHLRRYYESKKLKIIKYFKGNGLVDVYHNTKPPRGKILVSYIIDPYLLDDNSWRFHYHQKNWQAREIIKIFNKHRFSVDIYAHDDPTVAPKNYDNYDIIFGRGNNYKRFSQKVPQDTLRIYYATNMHWSQLNKAEKHRIQRFKNRHQITVTPSRQVNEFKLEDISDGIIIIGDENTVTTYKKNVEDTPLYRVRLSSWDFLDTTIYNKDFTQAKNNFLYFGGSGPILKGLDLLIEVFSELPNKHLYICGPLFDEPSIKQIYESSLERSNIHVMGHVRVGSDQFQELTKKCAFVILPSASESAGGSVIVCMHKGLIPIVTKEVFCDTYDWGFTLPNSNKNTIRSMIQEVSQYSSKECINVSKNARSHVKSEYTKETFSDDFNTAFISLLDSKNSKI